jgi:SAM-dependent methyltransferase
MALRAILRRLVRILFLTSNTIRYRVELPRLREALAKIGKVRFTLDVGAGSGYYAAEAYLAVSERLWAVEFDPKLCKILAQELARFGSRVRWLQGSILDLPFNSDEFDLVGCSQVLEHIADEGRAADELVRVIRPGGHLLILVPHPPAPWPEGDHVREGYTSAGLENLFAARGLTLCHTDYFLTSPTQQTIHLTHRLRERLPALLSLRELRMDAEERRAASPYGLLALFRRPVHPSQA